MNINGQEFRMGGMAHNPESLLSSFLQPRQYALTSEFEQYFRYNPEARPMLNYMLARVCNDNIIIPYRNIIQMRGKSYREDTEGMREYGYSVLSGEDLAKCIGFSDPERFNSIRVPVRQDLIGIQTSDSVDWLNPIQTEDYSMLLNVSYLVDEQSLERWLQGYEPIPERIREKKVDDCTVGELLFATKYKLTEESKKCRQ